MLLQGLSGHLPTAAIIQTVHGHPGPAFLIGGIGHLHAGASQLRTAFCNA